MFLFEGWVNREEISEHQKFAFKVFAARCFVAVVFLFRGSKDECSAVFPPQEGDKRGCHQNGDEHNRDKGKSQQF